MTDARERLEKAITHALTEFCEERMTEPQVQHHVLSELNAILDAMPENEGWIDAGVISSAPAEGLAVAHKLGPILSPGQGTYRVWLKPVENDE